MHKPKKKSRKNAKKTSKPSKLKKTAKVGKKAKAPAKTPTKVRTVVMSAATPVADRKTSGNGRIKILVSLPPDLVERLDGKVRKNGTNRSEEIRIAVELLLGV